MARRPARNVICAFGMILVLSPIYRVCAFDKPPPDIESQGDITPEMFGAGHEPAGYDTIYVLKAAAFAVDHGKRLLLLRKYRMTAQLAVDVSPVSKTGFAVIGEGTHRSGLVFDSTVRSPNMLIFAADAAFYEEFYGFTIQCNVAGVCLQIGREDLSDQHNELKLDLIIANISSDAAAVAIEMNAIYNADAVLVANGAGAFTPGTALRLRQTQFSRFFGSFGNAGKAIHLSGGYTVGNNFDALDIEEASVGVTIDASAAQDNHFIGGTLAGVSYGYNATAGARNVVDGPSLGIEPLHLFQNAVGIIAHLNGTAVMPTPPVPASGSGYTNKSGQEFMAYIFGGSVSSVTLDGATVSTSSPAALDVLPGDTVVLIYPPGSAPNWTWRPR